MQKFITVGTEQYPIVNRSNKTHKIIGTVTQNGVTYTLRRRPDDTIYACVGQIFQPTNTTY